MTPHASRPPWRRCSCSRARLTLRTVRATTTPGIASTRRSAGPSSGEDFDVDEAGVSGDVDDTHGISGRLGYRFHPHIAVELQADRYQDFDVDGTALGVPFDGKVEAWSLMSNGKAYLLTGQFQPYGLLGAGILDADITLTDDLGLGIKVSEDDTAFAWQVGAGVDYYLQDKDLAVTVEGAYHVPTGEPRRSEVLDADHRAPVPILRQA